MILTGAPRLVFKYRYGLYDTTLYTDHLKRGKWFINYNPNCIMFKNKNEFRIKKSYTHILKPGMFVRKINSQIINNNKILVDFNTEHSNCSEYSLLMQYCDEDLITCFILSKQYNESCKEKYTDEDFSLSF
jgi:hypothetical protein